VGAKLFREQVKALTDDRGADVIYDPVGGDVSDESMRCIAPFGRLLIVGFTSGHPVQLEANHRLIKDAEAIGFTIGGLSRLDPARERKNLAILMGWLAAGRITPHVSHRLPLAQAAEALKLVRERKVIGKAVLV
jgi:NADPH2:quinone reductase